MLEFLKECFFIVNLPATVLLLLVLVYWLLAILGVVSDEGLDSGADVDGDVIGSGSWLKGLTDFFYVGDIPIGVIGSFFALFFWLGTMISNHYFNPQQSLLISAVLFGPILILTLSATKLTLMPLARLFESRDRPITRDEFFNQVGRVTTSAVTPEFGQMEISQSGPPILLNVRSKPGAKLAKGDAARIIGYNPQNDTFLVELTKWKNSQ